MKNKSIKVFNGVKIKKAVLIISVILFAFLVNTKFAKAQSSSGGCCVGTPCEPNGSTDPGTIKCPIGKNYNSKSCEQIDACNSTTTNPALKASDCDQDCINSGSREEELASCITTCIKLRSNTASTPSSSTITFPNPVAFTTVSGFLNSVLGSLMGIIAIVAVIFIILGGVMYVISAGNEEMVTRAKKTWTGAIIGLAIALAAPTFLKEIQNLLGGSGPSGDAQAWISGALTIKQIAERVLTLLLSVIGILGIISLIIGGGMYMSAYGDEKRIDTAKRIITYAIIGIVVALAALVIVRQVMNILGA